jgi:hypothetical protein
MVPDPAIVVKTQQNTSAYYFLKVHSHHFLKIKSHKLVGIVEERMCEAEVKKSASLVVIPI